MAWITAALLEHLEVKPLVFKSSALQIALFRVDGKVFAIDNRCPHEGYPLAVGTVAPDCVLTCNWHNWKFRLEDGRCVVGGDNVRSYPTKLEGREVWVDVTPPPVEQVRAQTLKGLKRAFDERDFGRICREIARLHYNRLDPMDAVREAITWSWNRFEYGTNDSHAFAGAADWLALAASFGDDFERRLACLAESVDHMAFDSLRQPEFSYPESGESYERTAFLAAIEAEDKALAEGMIVQSLNAGLHWPDLEEAFAAAAFRHYNDFGHSAIYIPKITQLLEHLGPAIERYVLPPLVRQLCSASREDLIPEFKDYAGALRSLPEPRIGSAGAVTLDVPFPSTLNQAFDWLSESLRTADVMSVYGALLTALARSMLHYDTSYGTAFDRPVSDNVSWLGFTHGITFSNAVREVCTKYPQFWKAGLLQMACFLGRNHSYIDRDLELAKWAVDNTQTFFAEAHEQFLDHGINEPVFAVHLLKTTLAVEAELPHASPDCREALLSSLNRFLHSPLKRKHVRRLARQAIQLVSRDFEA
jgi:nitrite reductase/ring-hydroxylating ferredoxin subunit